MCEQCDSLETNGILEATKEDRKKMCKKHWSDEDESDYEKKKVLYHYNFIQLLIYIAF